MREILFRGKGRTDRRWYEGYYFALSTTTYCFAEDYAAHPENTKHYITVERMIDWGLPNEHLKAEIDPETVGQYTGLTDKNGKRIFEGDIIKTHYANTPKADFIEQVVFHNGRFCGMYESGKMKMWAPLPDGVKHFPQDKSVYMEWCEVIGNIHDNPELVEVAEDDKN